MLELNKIIERLGQLEEGGVIGPNEYFELSQNLVELTLVDDLDEQSAVLIESATRSLSELSDDPSELQEEMQQIEDYKIWGLVYGSHDPSMNPGGINYKTGLTQRLHPVLSMSKGELLKVEYYRDYLEGQPANKILCVDAEWVRSETGVLLTRIETRRWVVRFGDIEYGRHIKVTDKHYTPKLAALADARRRKNIVDDLTSQAGDFGVLSYVQTMFRTLDNELNAYEKTGDPKLIEKIGSYPGAWLDSPVPDTPYTLRQAIMGGLTI